MPGSIHPDLCAPREPAAIEISLASSRSQSGVLFIGPQPLPVNALTEMVFEMPEDISGQKNSNVVCSRPGDARQRQPGVRGRASWAGGLTFGRIPRKASARERSACQSRISD